MSIPTLENLNAQIQQLEAQRAQLQAAADQQRKEAAASLIQELIQKISTYGITAKELGLDPGRVAKGKAKLGRKPLGAQIAQAGKAGKIHTGPDGQTWTEGTRGRKPVWLTQQLAEAGVSDTTEAEAQ